MEITARGVRRATLCKEQSSDGRYLAYGDTAFRIATDADFADFGFRPDAVEVIADHALDALKKVELGNGPAVNPSEVFFSMPEHGPLGFPIDRGNKDIRGKVADRVLVAGWLEAAPEWHYGSGHWVEDIRYWLILDVDFIDRLYGPDGISTRLRAATLPGLPLDGDFTPVRPLPFGDLPPAPDGTRYATVGAFALPRFDAWVPPDSSLSHVKIHVELNCWHVHDCVGEMGHPGQFYAITGRGVAPQGWVNVHEASPQEPFPKTVVDDCWWRYDPNSPVAGQPLAPGSQVLMLGTLWEDEGHTANVWEARWPGHGTWLEMHPPDWIHRFHAVPPRRTAFALATTATSTTTTLQAGGIMRPGRPDGPAPSETRPTKVQEVVDARFMDNAEVAASTERHCVCIQQPSDDVKVDVLMRRPPPHPPRRPPPPGQKSLYFFKATYIADWAGASLLTPSITITSDRSEQVLIQASDSDSGDPVLGAEVLVDDVVAGVTGTAFSHTFASSWTWRIELDERHRPHRVPVWQHPTARLTIRAQGYSDVSVRVAWRNGSRPPNPD